MKAFLRGLVTCTVAVIAATCTVGGYFGIMIGLMYYPAALLAVMAAAAAVLTAWFKLAAPWWDERRARAADPPPPATTDPLLDVLGAELYHELRLLGTGQDHT